MSGNGEINQTLNHYFFMVGFKFDFIIYAGNKYKNEKIGKNCETVACPRLWLVVLRMYIL